MLEQQAGTVRMWSVLDPNLMLLRWFKIRVVYATLVVQVCCSATLQTFCYSISTMFGLLMMSKSLCLTEARQEV